MILTFEHKLYPNVTQAKTLEGWLHICCRVYNRALAQRIKAYKRRGESVTYNQQTVLLAKQRAHIEKLRLVPSCFARDALRRVDRGFKAFFRRMKAGQKPGFPRFRSWHRYTSLEYAAIGKYSGDGTIRVPGLGHVRSRGRAILEGKQKILRVVQRSTGWYAQIVVDDRLEVPKREPQSAIGIDVGLESFATLSNGATIQNPRIERKSHRKLRFAQRRLARCKKGSQNRRKAVWRIRRLHERIAAQRRDFCHQESTALVQRFDLIAFEKLNIKGMVRNRSLARAISDAAWGMFVGFVTYKAEYAGRHAVGVHAPGTSQECPNCGRIRSKELSEREHACECGLRCHRDHAAAQVILARALGGNQGVTPVEGMASTMPLVAAQQVGPVKQECILGSPRI
jgi:putative transposase